MTGSARIGRLRRGALLLAVGAMACGAAKVASAVGCADLLITARSTPPDTTIAVGASFQTTAYAGYDSCIGRPGQHLPGDFQWSVSDSNILRIVAVDSVHAEVTGLRPGSAAVVPKSVNGAPASSSISVTVIQP